MDVTCGHGAATTLEAYNIYCYIRDITRDPLLILIDIPNYAYRTPFARHFAKEGFTKRIRLQQCAVCIIHQITENQSNH
jgi:hypothetical protein